MVSNLFRQDLKDFKAYEAEQNNSLIKLDANESFLEVPEELKEDLIKSMINIPLNRYPDPTSKEVCSLYADYAGVASKNVIAGNGSDELIQITINAFINKDDKVMFLNPDFSMYRIYTKLAGGVPVEFPLDNEFKFDTDRLIDRVNSEDIKLLFISNPNNPTGGVTSEAALLKIIKNCSCIVVIDEAYYEFYGKSVADKINDFENLIVTRTCSKALGLAALRLGFLLTNEVLIAELKKVKPPYNVNLLTQTMGEFILRRTDLIKSNIATILGERNCLLESLSKIRCISVCTTEANFVLIKSEYSEEIKKLVEASGISIRTFRSQKLNNYLRITVGNRRENEALIRVLRGMQECLYE
jgi:histidinol-phosphate aminotransferase